MSYEDYVEKKLFAPLGMKRSSYCNSAENIERRAHGYQIQRGEIRRAPTNVHTWPYAAGSLCSTPGDLVTWLQALHGGKVLSPRSYTEMTTPARLNDGTPLRYGMGISVGKDDRGLAFIGHGGGIGGFTSEATWYPDARAAIVVLFNANGPISPGAVAADLAAQLLPWTPTTTRQFTGDATPLVGTYKGPSRGREMIMTVTQGVRGPMFSTNGSPAREASWEDGWSFRQGGTSLTFRRTGSAGPATELILQSEAAYYVLRRQ